MVRQLARRPVARVCGVAGAVLLVTGAMLAQDGLKSAGLTVSQAREIWLESLNSGRVPYYQAAAAFKLASPSARALLAQGLLAWTKGYVQTDHFKTAYAEMRENRKPAPPESKGSGEEQMRKIRAEQEKGIAEMKKTAASMPPEMRKQMEETIAQMVAQMERDAKDTKKGAAMAAIFDQAAVQEKARYEERVRQWQQEYPEDPKLLIIRRLEKFLEVSATVDFKAQMVPKGRMVQFANPAYEQKPDEWKLCFRAGPEAVNAARTFATTWLNELKATGHRP